MSGYHLLLGGWGRNKFWRVLIDCVTLEMEGSSELSLAQGLPGQAGVGVVERDIGFLGDI